MLRTFFVAPDRRRETLTLFFSEVSSEEREERVVEALAAAESGELSLEGLVLAERAGRGVGAALVVSQPDGTAFVWPPVVTDALEPEEVADALLRTLAEHIDRDSQCWIAQCLVEPDRTADRNRLTRNGFPHLVDLLFLQRPLDQPLPVVTTPRFDVESFDPGGNRARFVDVVRRSYEGSLDCPELNGRRSAEEALRSHQAAGPFQPSLWRLYRVEGRDVGVILMAPHPDQAVWELVYMGVVPEARGHGYGRAMLINALHAARAASVESVFLSVDRRNHYARALYQELGFFEVARRCVHARFGPRGRGR